MSEYDSIIIGAGHNGLTCAAYLARAGQKVLVLEASDTVGGLAGIREFHPGFRVPVAHAVNHFPSKIVSDLELAKHGFGASAGRLPLVGLGQVRHQRAQLDAAGSRHVRVRGVVAS